MAFWDFVTTGCNVKVSLENIVRTWLESVRMVLMQTWTWLRSPRKLVIKLRNCVKCVVRQKNWLILFCRT